MVVSIGTEVRVPGGKHGVVTDVLEEPWVRVMVEDNYTNEYRRDELTVWGRNER